MKVNPLPEDADALLAFAEAVATVLTEKQGYLDISTDVEPLLRASIAGATFAINRYVAIVADAQKEPRAHVYLAEARRLCYRSIEQLRRRVTRAVAYLTRFIHEKEIDVELAAHFV